MDGSADGPIAGQGAEPDDPPRQRLGGWGGCLGWAAAVVIIAIVGFAIGVVLRPAPPTEPERVANGQGWSVDVRRNDGDDPCIELFTGGGGDPRAGQCGFTVDEGNYQATSFGVGGNITVIFGPVPDGTERVRLTLANGEQTAVDVEEANTVRYFLYRSPAKDRGPTELLDADGEPVTIGG